MSMSGTDHHTFSRNANPFRNQLPGLFADGPMNAQQITNDQCQFRSTVVENQTPGMKVVMHMCRWKRHESTDDGGANRRRDIAGGGSRKQWLSA